MTVKWELCQKWLRYHVPQEHRGESRWHHLECPTQKELMPKLDLEGMADYQAKWKREAESRPRQHDAQRDLEKTMENSRTSKRLGHAGTDEFESMVDWDGIRVPWLFLQSWRNCKVLRIKDMSLKRASHVLSAGSHFLTKISGFHHSPQMLWAPGWNFIHSMHRSFPLPSCSKLEGAWTERQLKQDDLGFRTERI